VAGAENAHGPDQSVPAASSSPWPHTRQEAETEDIVHALRRYGVLTRARLLDICGAAHWSDSGAERALARRLQRTDPTARRRPVRDRRATQPMTTPPHEHARRAQSKDGNSASGAGNPAGAFIVRRRRAIDAVRRARRAGRLVSQPKRADQRPVRRSSHETRSVRCGAGLTKEPDRSPGLGRGSDRRYPTSNHHRFQIEPCGPVRLDLTAWAPAAARSASAWARERDSCASATRR
jgi:hypothetical protein